MIASWLAVFSVNQTFPSSPVATPGTPAPLVGIANSVDHTSGRHAADFVLARLAEPQVAIGSDGDTLTASLTAAKMAEWRGSWELAAGRENA
jgi:hypothetical protein